MCRLFEMVFLEMVHDLLYMIDFRTMDSVLLTDSLSNRQSITSKPDRQKWSGADISEQHRSIGTSVVAECPDAP
jgi:hypothetical protein